MKLQKKLLRKKHDDNRLSCLDTISMWHPIEYVEPKVMSDFKKTSDKFIRDTLKCLNADKYNDGLLDTFIDNLVSKAKKDLQMQRASHKDTIEYIRTCQQGKVNEYKKELEHLINERKMIMEKEVG